MNGFTIELRDQNTIYAICEDESAKYYIGNGDGTLYSKDNYRRTVKDESKWVDITHLLRINWDGVVEGDHYIAMISQIYRGKYRFVGDGDFNPASIKVERKI